MGSGGGWGLGHMVDFPIGFRWHSRPYGFYGSELLNSTAVQFEEDFEASWAPVSGSQPVPRSIYALSWCVNPGEL